jgi:hypothetical protein
VTRDRALCGDADHARTTFASCSGPDPSEPATPSHARSSHDLRVRGRYRSSTVVKGRPDRVRIVSACARPALANDPRTDSARLRRVPLRAWQRTAVSRPAPRLRSPLRGSPACWLPGRRLLTSQPAGNRGSRYGCPARARGGPPRVQTSRGCTTTRPGSPGTSLGYRTQGRSQNRPCTGTAYGPPPHPRSTRRRCRACPGARTGWAPCARPAVLQRMARPRSHGHRVRDPDRRSPGERSTAHPLPLLARRGPVGVRQRHTPSVATAVGSGEDPLHSARVCVGAEASRNPRLSLRLPRV